MLGSGDAGWTRTRSCHLWSLAYPALPAARVIPPTMSKRTKSRPKPQERGYVLFDVVYEDGSRASNRRVPVSAVGGLEGDERRVRPLAFVRGQGETHRPALAHPAPLERLREGVVVHHLNLDDGGALLL